MKIKDIVVDYGISIGTYYYWQDRYSKEGILGLVNKKTGAERPHNKTSNDIEEKILQITSENIELDAKDIFEIVKKQYEFDKSVRTIERILQRNGINRGKGRRSKKTMEKKNLIIQSQEMKLRQKM